MATRRLNIVFPILCFWFLGLVPLSWAEEEQEEIKSYNQLLNEVFQAETVYPQEEGEVQLLLGPTFSDGDDRNLFQVPFSIEYGITDVWQLEVAWDTFVTRNPETGATTRASGEESQTHFQAILNYTAIAIINITTDGIIEIFNPEKVTGWN